MKRERMAELARQIADEAERETYEYWRNQPFPIAYERTLDGEHVQVEITLDERNSEFIQIGISVDDGGISAYYPAGWSAVIYRGGCKPSNDPRDRVESGFPVGWALGALALIGLLTLVGLALGWLRFNI